jgi:microsomal epoxide hydrolase
MTRALFLLGCLSILCLPGVSRAQAQAADRFFVTSDGVRLHYLEAGPATAHTLVFIPGWTMPAWIWGPQIDAFSRQYHVIAFDPRGQGDSAAPQEGYEPVRRGRDIAELLTLMGPAPVVIVAWSLGVLDTLAAIHGQAERGHPDRMIAGLVLVDNSVGEEPPPPYHPPPKRVGPPLSREASMARFVRAMFRRTPPAAYLDRLTEACLRTPDAASRALLAYPVPRSYWKEAVYAAKVPLLYMIRPQWLAQGQNLMRNRPATEVEVFSDAGHALFLDEPTRFNRMMDSFLHRWIWP